MNLNFFLPPKIVRRRRVRVHVVCFGSNQKKAYDYRNLTSNSHDYRKKERKKEKTHGKKPTSFSSLFKTFPFDRVDWL